MKVGESFQISGGQYKYDRIFSFKVIFRAFYSKSTLKFHYIVRRIGFIVRALEICGIILSEKFERDPFCMY